MKNNLSILVLLLAGTASSTMFASSANAFAVTLDFNEGLVRDFTQLEGTNVYNSFGVSFESSRLVSNPRFLEDTRGITNGPTTTGGINFLNRALVVNLSWITAGVGIDFKATAYDSSNNVVDSFFFDGSLSPNTSGKATLSGNANIARVEYTNGGQQVGIDSLNYQQVPEPLTILSTVTALGFGALFKKKKLLSKAQ